MAPQAEIPLPPEVTSRFIPRVNGLNMHILEAGRDSEGDKTSRPLLLLLHGFPELAYSYRKVIQPLSRAGKGYYVVAPDQRGYGRTTGWDSDNLESFRILNLVTDIVALVLALGYQTVDCVIGHDFGSLVAGFCSLVRPDIFRSVVLMSAPFPGAPSFPRNDPGKSTTSPAEALVKELLALDPPRKHYQQYYSPPSLDANHDMLHAPQGVSAFLRGYYHVKSADWIQNNPHPLASWSATELCKVPEYYIMRADKTMPETVEPHFPSTASQCPWLTDEELSVYTAEFIRTSFQGGLNWYQFTINPQLELRLFAEKRIEVPAVYIAGEKDWGIYQAPGILEQMQTIVCEKMAPGDQGCRIVKGAGHWVQQEKADEVVRIITQFLRDNPVRRAA